MLKITAIKTMLLNSVWASWPAEGFQPETGSAGLFTCQQKRLFLDSGLRERVNFLLWDFMSTLYLSCKSCIQGNTALMLLSICSSLQSQTCLLGASGFSLSRPLHSFSEGLLLLTHCAVIFLWGVGQDGAGISRGCAPHRKA